MHDLKDILQQHQHEFSKVVEFNPATDKLLRFDFSQSNTALRTDYIANTEWFSLHISQSLKDAGAKYGIGGYAEDRVLYKKFEMFNSAGSSKVSPTGGDLEGAVASRSIHLGIDIWGPAGTKVFAPLGGMVHSFAYNNNEGDYGATILLQHQLDMVSFYTLYGHVSLANIANLRTGSFITRGQCFAHFGPPAENGNWPPHLHFQVITEMGQYEGDYPGVCTKSEKEKYLANSPDADLILGMMKYV